MKSDPLNSPRSAPSGTEPLPPPRVPDHELIRRIGRGAYGEVWLARSATGAFRAVKIVHRRSFDHDRPFERDSPALRMKEVDDFSSTLLIAIPARDAQVVSMVATTVGAELRELAERIPDHKDTSVEGGLDERRAARNAVKELVLNLRRIEIAAQAGDFDKAEAEYQTFSNQTFIVVPALLKKAQAWTLFNSGVSNAHYGAMRQMLQSSDGQVSNQPR